MVQGSHRDLKIDKKLKRKINALVCISSSTVLAICASYM